MIAFGFSHLLIFSRIRLLLARSSLVRLLLLLLRCFILVRGLRLFARRFLLLLGCVWLLDTLLIALLHDLTEPEAVREMTTEEVSYPRLQLPPEANCHRYDQLLRTGEAT